MLPSIIDRQIREGIQEYLKATFPSTTPLFENILNEFITTDGLLFKGPFISLGLPFRKGAGGTDIFPDIPLKFAPYAHQERAFSRLNKEQSKSTIIATGTGSGKTECFLVPILDYCLHKVSAGDRGVKAILVYPMNALATDQAIRLAKMIHTNSNLKGVVSAGLYVGQSQEHPYTIMGADHIITDKSTLRDTPPDILLTNYRMLDYMLDRPQDKKIWQHNRSGTLKYLAVDELHTFDGAQGTDLACLIRRLKARLAVPQGSLCCIGTSATLGSGEESIKSLVDYASQVFGESFAVDSIIQEERLSAKEFLDGSFLEYSLPIPLQGDVDKMNAALFGSIESYIRQQILLWFKETIVPAEFESLDWRKTLGEKLKSHIVFRTLLEELQKEIKDCKTIKDRLRSIFREFANGDVAYGDALIDSMFSLIAIARDTHGLPFLNLRFQSWLRELRRMVATVSSTPKLRFSDELSPDVSKVSLPLVHCRNCGAIGWTGIKKKNRVSLESDLQALYSTFFAHYPSPDIHFLFPSMDDFLEGPQKGQHKKVCTNCLTLIHKEETECPECSSKELLQVFVPLSISKRSNGDLYTKKDCPVCRERDALMIIGAQAASLSSVIINQLFASPYNDDKKLITFSDNVQDAAHRAGYFGSRTWSFNFRTALVKYLDNLPANTNLHDAHQQFPLYEREQLKSAAQYVSMFVPRNLMWMQEYSRMVETGRENISEEFLSMLDRRLGWEMYSEMSLEAKRGRTLEKAGCAVLVPLFPDNDRLQVLHTRLSNKIEWFRNCPVELLRNSLLGFIKHYVYNGAIYHQVLEQYITQMGKSFLISSAPHNAIIKWMPDYGKKARFPAFLSTKVADNFEILKRETTTGTTWLGEWYYKCFDEIHPLINDYFDDYYNECLKFLLESGLLFVKELEKENCKVYGLRPQSLIIESQTVLFQCSKCHHTIVAGQSEADLWDHVRCLKGSCYGVYERSLQNSSYYETLYRNGDTIRLYSHEHTGLLDRDTREKIEIEFKAKTDERKPWYPNLLSCTPTLEMGIDIGDLSSVLLCSVPPEQASYLQRIGRAGRKDGNSSCVTVANGTPHDCYFYASPKDMYDGSVATPGIFLDASAVLERQLTAYCLDCFIVEKGIEKIPYTVFDILRKFTKSDYKDFPNNFYGYVISNWQRLVQNFLALFGSLLSDSVCEKLRQFVDPTNGQSELEKRIVDGLRSLHNELESLELRRRKTAIEISKVQSDPGHDPEVLEELEKERAALNGLIGRVRNKKTYHYLTDEGLLPNYAFPEEGVQLKSVIYRKDKNDNGATSYKTSDYTYERAASYALADFAPGNTFYANGRQVKIDQVDMHGANREMWRFCPNCSFMQNLAQTGDVSKQCPICGSTFWGEASQKIEMLKVQQVLATTSEKDSIITDASENREIRFFVKEMFVNFDRKEITGAWQLDNEYFPFGFEFIRKTDFREVNFGDRGDIGTDRDINGKRLPVSGFHICRECGKVQNRYKTESQHTYFCKQKNKNDETSIISVLHLYREFTSESVRFLIPSASDYTQQQMESFLAALHLGLKLHFKGDISHLQLTVMTEPIEGSLQKKSYVILYDTVPGGTGYIGQIAHNPSLVFTVLKKALQSLLNCSCSRDPDADGCYRCLYRYKNANVMELISRKAAVVLLQDILKYEDRLKQVVTLSDISMNPVLESELEKRFVAVLQKKAADSPTFQMRPVTINGKTGYRILCNDYIWQMEPQVELGAAQGVLVPSRADFLLTELNGKVKKPIAVYTDGWQFHESRISLDAAQRMSLLYSGAYTIWSITWNDVEDFSKNNECIPGNVTNALVTDHSIYKKLLESLQIQDLNGVHNKNSMTLLYDYLQSPIDELWSKYAIAIQTYTAHTRTVSDQLWNQIVVENVPESIQEHWLKSFSKYGVFSLADIRFVVALGKMGTEISSVTNRNIILIDKHDGKPLEESWRLWLQLINVMQFVPLTWFGISKECEYSSTFQINPSLFAKENEQFSSAWMDIFAQVRYSGDDVLAIVKKCAAHIQMIPEVSYELTGSDGEVIAEAELAWIETKIAIITDVTGQECFERAGWRTFVLPEVNSDQLIDILKTEAHT